MAGDLAEAGSHAGTDSIRRQLFRRRPDGFSDSQNLWGGPTDFRNSDASPLYLPDSRSRKPVMKQALHIFKKDVRFLQREIALVAVLAIVLGWTEVRSPSPIW